MRLVIAAALLMASGSLKAAALPVVASFSVLGDVVKEIGGDKVNVVTLVGPDQDPHVYQLNPAGIQSIQAAKLVLVNGLGLEGAELLRAIDSSHVKKAVATDDMVTQEGEEDGKKVTDPHVWNDPLRMQVYAANVARALAQADPDNAVYYNRRFAEYVGKLIDLNRWAEAQLQPIAPDARKVLTSHDAFGYLGARYHIRFIAPQGVSSESEASAQMVASIIKQIRSDNFKAVFVENIKNPRQIQQITQETQVKISGALYSDALSAADGPANSYLNMARHNISLISQALH